MPPIFNVNGGGLMTTWLRQPFPPFIFSLLNTLTPLALPAAAMLAMSFTYMHRYTDMMSAMSEPTFLDPYHYDVYDYIVSMFCSLFTFSHFPPQNDIGVK
jgi:hypothetical protein